MKKSLLVFRTVLVACYFEKLAVMVDRNLCGYISNTGCALSLHACTENRTKFQVIVVKPSNFERRFIDKFSRGLCLDYTCSPMASQVRNLEKKVDSGAHFYC